ncbi:MAG: hypothetical protein WCQ95_02870 [Bacteroidota bacterium]
MLLVVISGTLHAQNTQKDSVLVIVNRVKSVSSKGKNVDSLRYLYFVKGNRIKYMTQDSIKHEGRINKIGFSYLEVHAAKVPLSEIIEVSNIPISNNLMILSGHDFDLFVHDIALKDYINLKTETKQKVKEIKTQSKGNRNLEYLHPHSITINIVAPFANQIVGTYSYRISKAFGFDISPGIYFQTPYKYPFFINIHKHAKRDGLQYDDNRLKGYQLNLGFKYYFKSKPNRYVEFMSFGRYLFYFNERVAAHSDNYGYELLYADQSERSSIMGFDFIYGWQKTIKKYLTFDFYAGIGTFYRRGKITEYGGGNHPNVFPGQSIYPHTYHTSSWFLSIQAGVKFGLRFGKAKTKS